MRTLRILKRSLNIIAGGLAFAVAAIAILLAAMFAVNRFSTQFPKPSGPFAVGRTRFDWGEQRVDELAPRPGIRRQLVVWVWYPAKRGTGTPAAYLPPRWRAALAHRSGTLMTDFLTRDLKKVHVYALANARLTSGQTQLPVVLLLAGNGALATFYTALAENMASHGYVVVGPEAAYRTSVLVLANGTVLYRPPRNDPDDLPAPQAVALATHLVGMWSSDLGFVLNQLTKLDSEPGGRFTGRLDLDHVGVVGHSLGGAVAAEFCRTDSRCQAGVDLDGRLFGPVITEGLSKPFMLMFEAALSPSNSNTARIFAQVHSMYAHLPASSRLGLSVAGANHFSFTDQMLVKNPIVLRLMRFAGAFGNLDGQRGLTITENSVRAFLDVYLKGLPKRDLHAVVAQYPELGIWED